MSTSRLSQAQTAILEYLAQGKSLTQGKGGFRDEHGRLVRAPTLTVLAALELLEPYEPDHGRVDYRLTQAGLALVRARHGAHGEAMLHDHHHPAPDQAYGQDTESIIREEAWRIAQERGDGDALGHWLEAERKIVAQGVAP